MQVWHLAKWALRSDQLNMMAVMVRTLSGWHLVLSP